MVKKIVCAMAIMCTMVLLMGISTMAYTQDDMDRLTGPATGVSYSQLSPDQWGQILNPQYGQLVNAVDCGDGTYLFEGKTYKVDYDWGEHCLTGYAATGNCTASGKMPTVYHTVSGPKALLGKVCLIKGQRLRNGSTGTEKTYDGIYVFEDTGGKAVEYGTERTMNVPVVDIYRETLEEAMKVTENGSIIAEVYILSEVK